MTIDLKLTPQRSALLAGHANEIHVLLQAQAPDAPAADSGKERAKMNLALVIDRSGSMSGRPLKEAKRCADMIVDALRTDDTISVIAYDNTVQLPVPAQSAQDKNGIKRAIARIREGGMTALHDGWLAGAEQAAGIQSSTGISRVLLLSDGCANEGLCDPDEIASHCGRLAHSGVTTSTYGLGNHFNEDLMTAMAKAGLGNAYYGETAEDLMDPFREEFDLLSNICARNLRLQVAPAEGVRAEVVNAYPVDETGRHMMPDLAYGGEAWALLRLSVPADLGESTPGQSIRLLDVVLTATDAEGLRPSEYSASLRLPRLPQGAFSAIAEDETVLARARELRAAEFQEQAMLAARRGDWREVDAVLARAEEEAEDNAWVRDALGSLKRLAARREQDRFSKAARYSIQKMQTRLADKYENAVDYSEAVEAKKAMFLRRKREQGKRLSDPDRPDEGRRPE